VICRTLGCPKTLNAGSCISSQDSISTPLMIIVKFVPQFQIPIDCLKLKVLVVALQDFIELNQSKYAPFV
jgi:hypothetical protein